VRIKDAASVQGLQELPLVGYGLVTGLRGTGDGVRTQFTIQSVLNMLKHLGITVSDRNLRLRNVAAVMISGILPPFAKQGSRIEITISSLGDANSLEGGVLLMSPLQGPDGKVYAVAQGSISIGGSNQLPLNKVFNKFRNHSLATTIPEGAIVEQEVITNKLNSDFVNIVLKDPDYTTAARMGNAINERFGGNLTKVIDAGTIRILIPGDFQVDNKIVEFIALVENVNVFTDQVARVVINERTGTIVVGRDVKISEVAISHGDLKIMIEEPAQQTAGTPAETAGPATTPLDISSAGFAADTTAGDSLSAASRKPALKENYLIHLKSTSTVQDLVDALNAIGAYPRDIIAIFEAIKKAGALHAELEIM